VPTHGRMRAKKAGDVYLPGFNRKSLLSEGEKMLARRLRWARPRISARISCCVDPAPMWRLRIVNALPAHGAPVSRVMVLSFLLAAVGVAWLNADAASAASDRKDGVSRPNIIFILADDLGWTDLSCMGSKYYETPNIDRLAREGMKLTNFCVSQNCAPTRACLMTGQYAPRTGVYTVSNLDRGPERGRKLHVPKNVKNLPLDRVTVADTLKKAGYATGMFGKWHLGGKGKFHPRHRGFDEAIVTSGGHYNFKTNPRVEIPEGAYLADFLTDCALRFVEKNKDRPFLLYLPHFAVHVPLQAKPELIEKYKNKPGVAGHNNPVYAAMIASVDESVGRILAKLDELKLADRTVVIFTSDNGGVGGYKAAGINAGENTDNSPLRSGKGSLYEGGLRVPFLVRWPRTIKPDNVCDEPAIHVDIFPTFVELAGAQRPKQPLDGLSIVPIFRDPKAQLDRDAVYWHFPGYLQAKGGDWRTTPVGVIRTRDFKLMEFYETHRLELYNLKEGISEKNNLADKMPGKVKELHAKLVAWREGLNAEMPRLKNSTPRPYTQPN